MNLHQNRFMQQIIYNLQSLILSVFNIIFSARVMLHIYPACLMYALQSAVVIVLKLGVIVVENATSLFTRHFLILLNTSSAGFRSGLYSGRNRIMAPVCCGFSSSVVVYWG